MAELANMELREALKAAESARLFAFVSTCIFVTVFLIAAGIFLFHFRWSIPAAFVFGIGCVIPISAFYLPYKKKFKAILINKWIGSALQGSVYESTKKPSPLELNYSYLFIAGTTCGDESSEACISISTKDGMLRCYEMSAASFRPIDPVVKSVRRNNSSGSYEKTYYTEGTTTINGLYTIIDMPGVTIPANFWMAIIPPNQPYQHDKDRLILKKEGQNLHLDVYRSTWPPEAKAHRHTTLKLFDDEMNLLSANEIIIMRESNQNLGSLSTSFDTHFTVFSNNQPLARAMLIAGISNELVSLSKHLEVEVLCSVVGNRLHLITQVKKAFSDPPFIKKIDESIISELQQYSFKVTTSIKAAQNLARIARRSAEQHNPGR